MRFFFLGILCLAFFSCREYTPFNAWVPVDGYQIDGTIVSPDGQPVKNVTVKVLYYYEKISSSPLDTVALRITDTTKFMSVVVYTPGNIHVKQLFGAYPSPGIFPLLYWNERTDSGLTVPSGKYLIRYTYGGTVVKENPYIVENTRTATSDVNGEFLLTHDALPVGEYFDVYDPELRGSFLGAYKISSLVRLVFIKGSSVTWQELEVQKNKLTRRVFTLQ